MPADPEVSSWAAVILAGGAGRRLGGAAKPTVPVAGVPMLGWVLTATVGATVRVVVGPEDLAVPSGTLRAQEEPPGGGPVAAASAGLRRIVNAGWSPELTALLAADLPLLTAPALTLLRHGFDRPDIEVACYIDLDGRRQSLCALWRTEALSRRLATLEQRRGELTGTAVRELFEGVTVAEVVASTTAGPPPWYDCDTPEDLRRAEGWARDERLGQLDRHRPRRS